MAKSPKKRSKKKRLPVPETTKAKVLYDSHHTCVVCNEPGRPVQIHHINEDSSDFSEKNLVVLCLICHDSTQIRGGFGRKLDADVVKKYRREWLKRVAARREAADKIVTSKMAGPLPAGTKEKNETRLSPASLLPYVMTLPASLAAAYQSARPRWDEGPFVEKRQATYDVIDVLEQMLMRLAGWCDPTHFGNMPAREFFSRHVSSRFLWRRGLAEVSYGGNITVDLTLGAVLADVEEDVAQLVEALLGEDHPDVVKDWREKWAAAKKEPEAAASAR